MKIFYALTALFFLTGCPSDPSDPPDSSGGVLEEVRLVCAETANTAEATHCNADAPLMGVSSTFINAGQISRGQIIESTIQAENFSAVIKAVWIEMVFDAGCNGAAEWVILPKQPVTIGAFQSLASTVGGQCGDMPLGARTLTASLYASDSVAVLDQVTVNFELIE